MSWFLFKIEVWVMARRVEQCHQWFGFKLRDRFDESPCRDCDVPEGMWW